MSTTEVNGVHGDEEPALTSTCGRRIHRHRWGAPSDAARCGCALFRPNQRESSVRPTPRARRLYVRDVRDGGYPHLLPHVTAAPSVNGADQLLRALRFRPSGQRISQASGSMAERHPSATSARDARHRSRCRARATTPILRRHQSPIRNVTCSPPSSAGSPRLASLDQACRRLIQEKR